MRSKPPIHEPTPRPRSGRGPDQCAGHRDPRADRADRLGDAEDRVRRPGEPLPVRVDDQRDHRQRRQRKAQRVEKRCRAEEDGECDEGAGPRSPDRDDAGDQLAPGGTGIARVDVAVDDPVGRHGERPGRDHRDGDEQQVDQCTCLLTAYMAESAAT